MESHPDTQDDSSQRDIGQLGGGPFGNLEVLGSAADLCDLGKYCEFLGWLINPNFLIFKIDELST